MYGNRFKGCHLPYHALLRAAYARSAHADRPNTRNLIEVPGCAGRMGHRSLATEFVETPALAVTFITESSGESAGVEMSAAGTVLMNDAVIGEFGPVELVERRQLAHGDVLENHGQEVVRIRRATRKVDDEFA